MQNAMNLVIIIFIKIKKFMNENESFDQSGNKYQELKTKTDFIKSKNEQYGFNDYQDIVFQQD